MSLESLLRRPAQPADFDRNNAYYEGLARLDALGVTLPPQVRVLELIVNWPRLVVDSIVERMNVEGFRLAGEASTDDLMWSWWQANRLDEESMLAHLEALVQRCSFAIVGPGRDPEIPAITVHSSKGMYFRVDALSRDVVEAARTYTVDDQDWAAWYTPEFTEYYYRSGVWKFDRRVPHDAGMVPVVPFVNRARVDDRHGRTEMADVISLTDAASRTLTSMQIAQELVALPQRYVVGASEEDFQDANGNLKTAWESYIGRIAIFGNEQAKPGQFQGANLQPFTEVVNHYARQVCSMSGLPPHFLGFVSENPTSADAIRAGEARLVTRVEMKQRAFGESWERVMQCASRMVGAQADVSRLETVWRDAATPTLASKADAAVKLFSSGLLPADMARELIGFTAEQRKRAAELDGDPVLAGQYGLPGVSQSA